MSSETQYIALCEGPTEIHTLLPLFHRLTVEVKDDAPRKQTVITEHPGILFPRDSSGDAVDTLIVFDSDKREVQLSLKEREYYLELKNIQGKGNLKKFLAPYLKLAASRKQTRIRVLALIDLDDNEIPREKEEVLKWIKREHDLDAYFEKGDADNVFVLHTEKLANLRLVMHIASFNCSPALNKPSTDDYILKLALTESTSLNLYKKRARKDWDDNLASTLKEIIGSEIPTSVESKFKKALYAKQLGLMYAALIDPGASLHVFAKKVVEGSRPEDLRKVFGSLIEAINILRA